MTHTHNKTEDNLPAVKSGHDLLPGCTGNTTSMTMVSQQHDDPAQVSTSAISDAFGNEYLTNTGQQQSEQEHGHNQNIICEFIETCDDVQTIHIIELRQIGNSSAGVYHAQAIAEHGCGADFLFHAENLSS